MDKKMIYKFNKRIEQISNRRSVNQPNEQYILYTETL